MLSILAGGGVTIMTAGAIVADAGMIERRRDPCLSTVTITTLAGGSQVIGVFTRGGIAIMTTRARAQYFVMIDGRRR